MSFSQLLPTSHIQSTKLALATCLLTLLLFLCLITPAWASIDDDRYDGNIFVLYAGNGSLVPAKQTLAQSLKQKRPTLLAFYLDDSSDCKQYALVISRFQEYYGRAANILPVNVDGIPEQPSYTPEEPGYYYDGLLPQVVVIDQEGEVAFKGTGQVPFEEVDDTLRDVFNLLPRTESVELKRRSFNEFNSELTQ